MTPPNRPCSFVGRELEAKRIIRKAQLEFVVLHQGRLTALDGVGARGLSILTLMISVAALLCATMPLSGDGKYLIVLMSLVGAFAIILPMVTAARAKAGQVRTEYLRDSRELFGDPPPFELVSWLLDSRLGKRSARSGRR